MGGSGWLVLEGTRLLAILLLASDAMSKGFDLYSAEERSETRRNVSSSPGEERNGVGLKPDSGTPRRPGDFHRPAGQKSWRDKSPPSQVAPVPSSQLADT